jgi:DNA replication licensing factor MCM6
VRDLTYKLAFLANHVRAIDSADESMGDKELTEEEVAAQFTPEQREEIARMAETPDLYRKMVQSITPAVYGHEEVKRGVLLMLFGGVHKRTPGAWSSVALPLTRSLQRAWRCVETSTCA